MVCLSYCRTGLTADTRRQCALGLVAETISLGVLGLPAALLTLGLIPGTILLQLVGAVAYYGGYEIWRLKMRHPHIHSMGDAGQIIFGRFGNVLFGYGTLLYIAFIMAAHLVAGAKALDFLSGHKTCIVAWVGLIVAVSFVFTIPRTLKGTTFLSAVSFLSIFLAILIVMIDIGSHRPGFEEVDGAMPAMYTLWGKPDTKFTEKVSAFTTMMFAFSGSIAFFPFMSELKDTADFPKSLGFLMVWEITMYTAVAVVVYVCAGDFVRTPAIETASPTMRKVAWIAALGTIIIAGVISAHVAVKQVYVQISHRSKEDLMHQRSLKAWGYWLGMVAASWVLAFLLAESLPLFEDILSISGSLFASWFTIGLPGMFWLHSNCKMMRTKRHTMWFALRKEWTWKEGLLFTINLLFVIGAGFAVRESFCPSETC